MEIVFIGIYFWFCDVYYVMVEYYWCSNVIKIIFFFVFGRGILNWDKNIFIIVNVKIGKFFFY